ncbi:hypothetical protein HX810_03295 [Pseudomonas salomonii]|uniref:Uncharacterized protein n=1 Tax=Pseudomonas salomonii TaxID=191391 RepID=A0A7Y8KLE9_9PSED|nr:hypothetical protein [Pseudomonas salomonii]NWF06699.1 hypothetical protein [Pseudomonas salomonii]
MAEKHCLKAADRAGVPAQVALANRIDWGVIVDAFLMKAARVGNRYAAEAYLDRSGLISDGMTVVTPDVVQVARAGEFVMVRSICQNDHYVIVTELVSGGDDVKQRCSR